MVDFNLKIIIIIYVLSTQNHCIRHTGYNTKKFYFIQQLFLLVINSK